MKAKRFLSMFMALVMLVSINMVSAYTAPVEISEEFVAETMWEFTPTEVFLEDGVVVNVDTSDVELMIDSDSAFSNADLQDNFVHYADENREFHIPLVDHGNEWLLQISMQQVVNLLM